VRAALRLLGNLLRIGLWPLWVASRRLRRPRGRFVELHLHPHPVEVAGRAPLWQRLLRRTGDRGLRSIEELRQLAALIASDPSIDGLLLHLPHLRAGWATCQSVREVLLRLRAQGKRVVVYLPLGGGNHELYVALAGDRVLTAPHAPISLLGVGSQAFYLKPLLDRVGLQAEVHAHGEYKTAGESLLRETMSEPQREQVGALIAAVQRELEQAVAARAGLDAERARALFERGVWGAAAALEAGVLDACRYEDELAGELGGPAGGRPVPALRYLAWRRARLWRRVRRLPEIAVIPVHGAIVHAAPVTQLPGSRVAVLGSVVSALRRARESKRVSAVLLHVDSPGGSALASDLIHRELVRLREKKPVVAYFGDVAASGGYYVGAPCQRIVAQATTVTGSIGVVSVRMLGSVLSERLGLRLETLRAAPHADMGSPFRALDPGEQAMIWAETDAIYQSFVGVVAQGRQRTTDEVDRVARGRVWSGTDALGCGLVDELGGFDRALASLRALSPALRDLSEDQVALRVMTGSAEPTPPPEPLAATWWAGLLANVPSEFREALWLFGGDEHALCYALLPELR
jgi:protease-4